MAKSGRENTKSIVKRLSAESIKILKSYDPTFEVGNPSPDAAIMTMHMMAHKEEIVANSTDLQEKSPVINCKYDENRLLGRMKAIMQDACEAALQPYVQQ